MTPSAPPDSSTDRLAIRRRIRAERRSLPEDYRTTAVARITGCIRRVPAFQRAVRIGAFIAFDGEPDLSTLFGIQGDRRFFVPVIDADDMRFARHDPAAAQRRNRFGIAEPRDPRFVPASTLDLVLTPLVAFDPRGVRIGVGRGYYDRCFAFLAGRRCWFRPRLLGVAFDCQRLDAIPANPWDVPLWGVVTESGFRRFS